MATITETGTIDLKAQKEAHDEAISAAATDATSKANAAAKTATNYITPDGTNTAAFHPEASSTNQVKVDSTGVDIIKSGTSVAKYGDVSRIGKQSESRIELDYHSLKLIDKDGNTYFHVSDLRDANGSATISETFVVDDTEISEYGTRFKLSYDIKTPVNDNIISVMVDDVVLDTSEYVAGTPYYLRIYAVLNLGQNVQIEYLTETATIAFSFGQRAPDSTVGGGSFAEGRNNIASGRFSHAEGVSTKASGSTSHAEGYHTQASNVYSHAEGQYTQAIGSTSHAEGQHTQAIGSTSHAEGGYTGASSDGSHAEGWLTVSSGTYSHAEGYQARASGNASHAEGMLTEASGGYSHAEGRGTEANGSYSHAQNHGTIARGEAQTAIGKYNIDNIDEDLAFIIGNGTDDNARSDAFTVDWDGNTSPSGNIKLKSPTIDRDGTAPSSSIYDNIHCFEFSDADNENIGRVRMHQASNGYVGITMQCRNEKTDGTEVFNEISASVGRDGTRVYGIADPAAFRSAISAFGTSGGTITGPVYAKNTVIDRKVNPSSAQYSTDVGGNSAFRLVDKNGLDLVYIRADKQTDGRTGLDLRAWNSDTDGNNVVSGGIHILINRSGTVTYAVANSNNFRDAIGASSGIFPRSVGGTGMSARTTGTVTRSGVTTAGTFAAYSNGVVCTVTGHALVLKTALASGSNVNIGTLPTGYRPPTNMYGTIHAESSARNNKGFIRITSDGIVRFSNYSDISWATNYTIAFTITWAL